MATTATLPQISLPSTTGSGRSRLALVISFLLFLNFAYFLFSSGRVHTIDEVSAEFQAESLAQRGNAEIPQAMSANMFYGTMDRFGGPESPYPPGQALAMLPWYATGVLVAKYLPGAPRDPRNLRDFFLTGESAFFCALAAALALCIFLQLGIAPKISLMAAGILALATPLAVYSGWLFSEPVAAGLLLGAVAVLFAWPQALPISVARALCAGALLATALWVRPTHVIVVPVFLVALFVREREKGWAAAAALAAGAGAGVILLLWRNANLHGSPFDFGYPSAAEGGKALNTFQTPFTTGLLGFLVSPGKSIFLFSPPILLAMLGLPRLWRRDRGVAFVAAAAPIVYLLFFATYTQWEGGYCYGPRYLVPALALLGLGLGPALDRASRGTRITAIAVFIAGFFVQAVGSAASFLEADVAGSYYDAHYNYHMSFSPVTMHIHLLLHYMTSDTAPLGRGFDKWWVFLSKAGASPGALWIVAGTLVAGAGLSASWLWRGFRIIKRAEGLH